MNLIFSDHGTITSNFHAHTQKNPKKTKKQKQTYKKTYKT